MKAITIRGIDTEVSSRLKQIAEEEKKSEGLMRYNSGGAFPACFYFFR